MRRAGGLLLVAALVAALVIAVWPDGSPQPGPSAAPLVEPAPGPAGARKAMWGPVVHEGRSQFPIYEELGVDTFQYTLTWDTVAPDRPADPRDPADPAYRWPAELDLAVREAARYGIELSVTITFAPEWANGSQGRTAPPTDPRAYADFAYAASRRYPSVASWLIWGEPNRAGNFEPQLPRGEGVAQGKPRHYAILLDAAYGALKEADAADNVIGGNTFTVGEVLPRDWIANLRLPNGKPPRMDLYGHNPYTTRRPDLGEEPLVDGTADFSDLDTLAGWIDENLRPPPLRRGPETMRLPTELPLYLSEFTVPTDQPNYVLNVHVDRETQAQWLDAAFTIVEGSDRIHTLGWFQLRDQPPNADGDEARWGLIDNEGRRKPAFDVFAGAR
ncbi:MAG: hypothetical protein MSC31_03315 [Solirubrobacteraceae bacterium MAG38_C4-C5]|nr:hypothetical protein [Candidatus Siliceabacter maunaloa]